MKLFQFYNRTVYGSGNSGYLLCTIGMLLFRFPYAPMIGAFIGDYGADPHCGGAYLGAAVGAFMILTVDPLEGASVHYIYCSAAAAGRKPDISQSCRFPPSAFPVSACWRPVTVGGGLGGIGGMLLRCSGCGNRL